LTVLVNDVGGSAASKLTAAVGMLALLTFVTLRAYPPGAKIPWVPLVLLTLLTVLIPFLYVTWLWLSGKKWAEQPATT
jgi:uncharacterized membrane protein (UPF0136 family)